ncbi:MAG: hypothetical protein O2798_00695 [Chloroflexi bacterium]|nr:hypothetical protein [Chloroflexota bacterium]MDA1239340.1 hypothetical protein [Chloroflexota bacterium]
MALPYPGNLPRNVNHDAKYSVVHDSDGDMRVRLLYTLSEGERALLSTDKHPKLVAMVNEVKDEIHGAPGGAFYINEYRQVIVPTNTAYFFAGTYETLLEFEFEGKVIGPKASSTVTPGDTWIGPHVGIPYTLAAGGRDFYYEVETRPSVTKRVTLSAAVGAPAAAALARRLAEVKGSQGGRVYINEAREFFAPIEVGGAWQQRYLGPLGKDAWFPQPSV